MVVALAAPLASVRAEEAGGAPTPSVTAELPRDQGWNTGSWALLFDMNNVFTREVILTDHAQFGVGFEYFLSQVMALRVGASYGYTSSPAQFNKNTQETGGTGAVTGYSVDIDVNDLHTYRPTSTSDFKARVDFLYRLMTGAVAPYAGAGVFYKWHNESMDFADDISVVDQTTTVHDYTREQSGGLRGLLGAEWRLHPNFSLFAEYSLDVTLASQTATVTSHTTEVSVSGERTVSRVKNDRQTPASYGTKTALTHVGQLGLAVHF